VSTAVGDEAAIVAAIRTLLSRRDASASICPSEVARALDHDWRDLMRPVREAAGMMAARGELRITRGVDGVAHKDLHLGAIRLRRGPGFDSPRG
jgi:Protein of unknown function (DUF3253)